MENNNKIYESPEQQVIRLELEVKDSKESSDFYFNRLKRDNERILELEKECFELKKDKALLNWLEHFLQLGGSSLSCQSTYEVYKEREDDTEHTKWNTAFSLGYSMELENRGTYRWEELSNGTRSIRLAIMAARLKHDNGEIHTNANKRESK